MNDSKLLSRYREVISIIKAHKSLSFNEIGEVSGISGSHVKNMYNDRKKIHDGVIDQIISSFKEIFEETTLEKIPRDRPDLAIEEYKEIADRIKLLTAEIRSLKDRQSYIEEAFPELGGLKNLNH